MNRDEFERLLETVTKQLTSEARATPFTSARAFESRVRDVVHENLQETTIDFDPHPQAFPDIAVEEFGIEVKFTTGDTWRSVANSVLETNRIDAVQFIYIVFGKMGGTPEVKWGDYEKSVIHVRTSHVPRFEVEIGAEQSLFEQMGVSYDDFRGSEMHEKMEHIRAYARGRLNSGERLWWLEDQPGEEHSLPIQARLYTELPDEEKKRLRAEAVLLCPEVVSSGRLRNKYNDAVLYLLTYHGVLAHQARDMFSAGSVANPTNDDEGGSYVQRAIKLLEDEIREAAKRMDDALFIEYWGHSVAPDERIREWLKLADDRAKDWTPSKILFLDEST